MSIIDEYWATLKRNGVGTELVRWLDADDPDEREWTRQALREEHFQLVEQTSSWWQAVDMALEVGPLEFALLFERLDADIQRREREAWRTWWESDTDESAARYARRYLEHREQQMRLVEAVRQWRENTV